MNFKKVVLVSILSSTISTFLSIIWVILQPFALSKILSNLFTVSLIALILLIKSEKTNKFYDKKFWLYALSFNIPLIFHYSSQVILNVADRVMIGYYVGLEYTAYYSLAYSISMILNVLSASIFAVYTPWVFRKLQNSKQEIPFITSKLLNLFSFSTIFFIVFSEIILKFFASQEYSLALRVMAPVTLSTFFIASYGFFAAIQFYHSKIKFIIFVSLFTAILNILLNAYSIPRFGFVSAGYTTLISYFLYFFLHFIYTYKILKSRYANVIVFNFRNFFLVALITIILSFVFVFFDFGFYKYLIFIGISVYFLIFNVNFKMKKLN